jgi:RNase P/RNase MRP subunit p29
MIRLPALVAACAAAMALVCPAAYAKDVIELNSGEKVEGKFVDENRTEVTIQTDETKLVLPKSMIKTMKIEMEEVTLNDGRTVMGQIEKETDSSLTLRMRLGGLTVDKMDIEGRSTKVVEQKPLIWEKKESGGTVESQRPSRRRGADTGLEDIVFPKPTENLSVNEIRELHAQAIRLLQDKRYKQSIELY